MINKKLISVLLCGALLVCTFSACSAVPSGNTEETGTTTIEVVTNTDGSAVTTPDGSAVTEIVTEAASEASTDVTSVTGETTTAPSTSASSVKLESTSAPNKQTGNNKKKNKKKKNNTTTTTTEPEITYIDIVLQKNRKAKCSSPNVMLSTGEVLIEKPGDYRITSTTDDWHGKIIVKLKNSEKAELRFENVKITNNSRSIIELIDKSITTSRSFLETESETASDEIKDISDNDLAPNVQLSFPEGTKSYFQTSANSVTGVLYNESKLTIKGHGSATFASIKAANNCICSTKSIKIRNLSLNLTTAQNENTSTMASATGSARGIFSYSKVTLESGSLYAKTNGDALRCDEFIAESGSASLTSSACDAIDADDAIVINGGTITCTALEKACFKVRRINNTEIGAPKGCVRTAADTFAINGGTVRGEGKRITTVQGSASKQPSITCKIVKPSRGTEAAALESKVPAIIEIKGVKKSSNKCTKFLYSSSGITKNKEYEATANGKKAKTAWKGSAAVIDIESTNNR
ncbi:MAG: carbohydrate-binding domain-containing protein [Eubacterium sp.]|nr:carbohydrate-binding domain-containing protein [Eubacterium sp.]